MTLRNLVIAAGLLAMVPACSSAVSDDTSSSSAASLSSTDMIVEGSVATGQAVTVTYDPADYPAQTPGAAAALPFIAVRLVATTGPSNVGTGEAAAASPTSISVTGQFPGTPNVIAVDHELKVIAQTKGVAEGGVAHAQLDLPAGSNAELILVRDEQWVRPMPFTLSAQ